MSETPGKKHVPRKENLPPPAKPSQPAKDDERGSEDIERAVYDGMQDLRTEKPK